MPRLDLRAIVDALDDGSAHPEPVVPADWLADLVAEVLGIEGLPARARLRSRLSDGGLLEIEALADASVDELIATLEPRSDGAKKRLRVLLRFARWLAEREEEGWDAVPTSMLREELAKISGLGPSTVESILLFAFGREAYPIDRSTFRVFVRHGWLDATSEVDEARELIVSSAGDDPSVLRRLSRGLDRIGRIACRPSRAICDRCPLAPWLPECGPLGSEA